MQAHDTPIGGCLKHKKSKGKLWFPARFRSVTRVVPAVANSRITSSGLTQYFQESSMNHFFKLSCYVKLPRFSMDKRAKAQKQLITLTVASAFRKRRKGRERALLEPIAALMQKESR